MKRLLRKITGWMVNKTNYTPELPLPIQPIIITPEELKKFHSQKILPHFEYHYSKVDPDYFVRMFKYDVMENFMKEIEIKTEETPDGIMISCDLLFKNI